MAVSCGVGCRRGSNRVLLWLSCRQVATALIRPLAWEPPYTTGAALEKAERPKKEKKEKKKYTFNVTMKNKPFYNILLTRKKL